MKRVPYEPSFSEADAADSACFETPRNPPEPPLSLVMPMAGRGSRFARGEATLPKPLIDLGGKPFFWWATESVRRLAPVGEMVFVVLKEHVERFAIDAAVRRYYPDAKIVSLPHVTAGAAETAALGVAALESAGPVALCDSDHGFAAGDASGLIAGLRRGTDAALLCFASSDPAYSYARLGEEGAVAGTVEKQAVSRFAIAGCYLFASPQIYLAAYAGYRGHCPYDEYYVSGVYNHLIAGGGRVAKHVLQRHLSFGTPEELAAVHAAADLRRLWEPAR